MKKVYLCIIVLLLVANVACGDDRANTVELPDTTVAVTAETEIIPTEEPTIAPTDEPTPEPEATETVEPTETPEPTATAEPTETPEPTPTAEPLDTDLDEEQLKASLLTINDMPTGWTGAAAEFEIREPGGTYTFTCTQLPARSLGNVSVDFQQSGFGPFLSETISVYETKNDAKDALADLSTAAGECLEWTDDDGVTFTIAPLSFPNMGDETFAVRLTGNIEGDLIYLREGNVMINILHAVFPAGVDSALTEEMAILALERFKENN